MNQRDLVPAGRLAQQSGVKGIFYGPPGSGKTPLIETAPRPFMLVCEPGMLSMRTSNVPCYAAPTGKHIAEFFEWLFQSREVDQFDTVGIDSGSELAEIILREKFAVNKDGRKAYGEMSKTCTDWFDGLYHLKRKHVYIICKQGALETVSTAFVGGIPTITTNRRVQPYFPGQDLPMKVSHKYDLVCQVNRGPVPGVNGELTYFRCKGSDTLTARDRSGKLDEFEEPNLTKLFAKAMS